MASEAKQETQNINMNNPWEGFAILTSKKRKCKKHLKEDHFKYIVKTKSSENLSKICKA